MKREPKLQLYRATDGWRWRLRGRNSLILADSGQGYSRKDAASRGDVQVEEVVPSVIEEARPRRSADHPTMKPVALVERMLKNNARPGDLVLDPFGGSGSTLVAADRMGMSARVIELDPRFADVIIRRWQDYTGRRAQRADGTLFPAEPPQEG